MVLPILLAAGQSFAAGDAGEDSQKRVEAFLNRLVQQQQDRIVDLEKQIESFNCPAPLVQSKPPQVVPAASAPSPSESGHACSPPDQPSPDAKAAEQALHDRQQRLERGESALRDAIRLVIDKVLAGVKETVSCPKFDVAAAQEGVGWTVSATVSNDQDAAAVQKALAALPDKLVQVKLDTNGGCGVDLDRVWTLVANAKGRVEELSWSLVRPSFGRLPDRSECQSAGEALDRSRAFQEFVQRTKMPEPQFWVRDGERAGLCIRRKGEGGGWMLRPDRSVTDDLGLGVQRHGGGRPSGRNPN